MQIVLTGYMGSGKSLTGTLLAERLDCRFIDLDDFIAQQEKMSIPGLFRIKGEVYFRKKERLYLESVLQTAGKTVIALGGGTPCYGDNMALILSRTPYVFYLKATVNTLAGRLQKEQHARPLIKTIKKEELPEFIGKHLFERNYFYMKAPHIIAVDNLKPGEIADGIIKQILQE